MNREAEKYNTIKTAQIEWSEKIKPEFIIEYIRYKSRENEVNKNLRLYANLIQTQSNDEVVVFTDPQKYRGVQGQSTNNPLIPGTKINKTPSLSRFPLDNLSKITAPADMGSFMSNARKIMLMTQSTFSFTSQEKPYTIIEPELPSYNLERNVLLKRLSVLAKRFDLTMPRYIALELDTSQNCN